MAIRLILRGILLFVLITVVSCKQFDSNSQVDEGKIVNNIYTSDEIGWAMKIPDGWDVIEKSQSNKRNEVGKDALEETLDGEIDFSQLRNLISFEKDVFNNFHATSEPFKLEYQGEWEDNNKFLKGVIYTTYQNRGIPTDSSATTIETIDGLDFHTYSFTIYSKDGDTIMHQILYSCYVNGLDFGVNMNFNTKAHGDALLKAFRSSKFKKK